MKVIALYPFLREELNLRFLKISIQSLYKIVDEIIILIDHHNKDLDLKINIFLKKKIKIYYEHNQKRRAYAPRKKLLKLGRKHKGTHFIWLDCDEAFTFPFSSHGRKIIRNLKIGEKIQMRWLSIWKDYRFYRNDKKSIWSNSYKDFIVHDDPRYNFKKINYVDEPRTQGPNLKKKTIFLDINHGAVMHYQFINWNNFQLKQAWYMCQELLNNNKNSFQINRKYFFTYFDNFPKIKKINTNWLKHVNKSYVKNLNFDTSEYWKNRFISLFNNFNILTFKNLYIWNNKILKNIFFDNQKRSPKLDFLNKLNIFLYGMIEIYRFCKNYILKR